MNAIAADLTSFLAWAIALTMIAALILGGLIGWVRSRERRKPDDFHGDTLL